jgi:hypothetical protein
MKYATDCGVTPAHNSRFFISRTAAREALGKV